MLFLVGPFGIYTVCARIRLESRCVWGAAAGVLMVALVVVANIYVLAFAVDAGERSRMRT